MPDIDITDPGSVNVEDQTFGEGLPAQVPPFGSTPGNLAGELVEAADFAPGQGVPAQVEQDQVAEQATSATPLDNFRGDAGIPESGLPEEVIENDVVGQPSSVPPVDSFDGDIGNIVTLSSEEVYVGRNVVDQTYGEGTPTNVFV